MNEVERKDEAVPELAAEVVSDVVGVTEPAFWVSELVEVHGLMAWESSQMAHFLLLLSEGGKRHII